MQRAKFFLVGFLFVLLSAHPVNAADYDISASVSSSPELLQAEQLLSTITVQPDHIFIGQPVTVTIALKGVDQRPVAAHTVTIQLLQRGTPREVKGKSDADGMFTTKFTPAEQGKITVHAVDTSYKPALALSADASITVDTPTPLQAFLSFLRQLFIPPSR